MGVMKYLKLFEQDFDDPFGEERLNNKHKINFVSISPILKSMDRNILEQEIDKTIKSLVDNESVYRKMVLLTRKTLMESNPNSRQLEYHIIKNDDLQNQLFKNYNLEINDGTDSFEDNPNIKLTFDCEVDFDPTFRESHIKDFIWRGTILEILKAFNYRVQKEIVLELQEKSDKFWLNNEELIEQIDTIISIMSSNLNITILE